jgi:hypothetical protein
MIYLLSMKELIRKVLTESREVKTGDFTGLEKVIVKDAQKLIKDYPYLDSVYGVNGIEVVGDSLEGRVIIKLKPELSKYFRESRSDYDEVNNFYIYYGIQVNQKLPKELFETADIYTFEHRLEDILETKLGLNTKIAGFNVYFAITPEDGRINESNDKSISSIDKNSKLEKIVASFVKGRFDKSILTDNFHDVVVNIYNTDYGVQCHVTVLMKKGFSREESDRFHNTMSNVRSVIREFFPEFKAGISFNTETLESYNKGKWWYEEKKKPLQESESKALKLIEKQGLFNFLDMSNLSPYQLGRKFDLDALPKGVKYQFLDDTAEHLFSQWLSDYVSGDKLSSLMYQTKTNNGNRNYEIQYFGEGGVTGERFNNDRQYLGLINLAYSELPEYIFNNLYEIVLYDVYYKGIHKED